MRSHFHFVSTAQPILAQELTGAPARKRRTLTLEDQQLSIGVVCASLSRPGVDRNPQASGDGRRHHHHHHHRFVVLCKTGREVARPDNKATSYAATRPPVTSCLFSRQRGSPCARNEQYKASGRPSAFAFDRPAGGPTTSIDRGKQSKRKMWCGINPATFLPYARCMAAQT